MYPYLVLRNGGYTKHFYIEGQRITSKLGSGNGADTKNNKAGGNEVNYPGKQGQVQEGIVRNLKFLGQDGAILTAGKSGKVPPGQIIGGGNNGGGPNKDKESFMYFFHPDHLGSSSYITDASGEVYQHLEYFAFGETFVEEHSNTDRTPYLFNGKELDEETGLYYYGARYYDPRTSVWQSVDPLAEKYPSMSAYAYVANNPINAIDPDGREIIFLIRDKNNSNTITYTLTYRSGNFYHENGKRYNPGKEAISKDLYRVLAEYRKIEKSGDEVLIKQLRTLEKSKQKHYVESGVTNAVSPYDPATGSVSETNRKIKDGIPVGTHTTFTFSESSKKDFEESVGVPNSNFSTVIHEMRHQYDYDQGKMGDSVGIDSSAEDPAEIRAVYNENRGREIEGLQKRTTYGGKQIDPAKLKSPPGN